MPVTIDLDLVFPSGSRRSGRQLPVGRGCGNFGRFWGRARLELQIIPLDLPYLFSPFPSPSPPALLDLELIVEKSCVLVDVDGG